VSSRDMRLNLNMGSGVDEKGNCSRWQFIHDHVQSPWPFYFPVSSLLLTSRCHSPRYHQRYIPGLIPGHKGDSSQDFGALSPNTIISLVVTSSITRYALSLSYLTNLRITLLWQIFDAMSSTNTIFCSASAESFLALVNINVERTILKQE
jgi:hypothetical protein